MNPDERPAHVAQPGWGTTAAIALGASLVTVLLYLVWFAAV